MCDFHTNVWAAGESDAVQNLIWETERCLLNMELNINIFI